MNRTCCVNPVALWTIDCHLSIKAGASELKATPKDADDCVFRTRTRTNFLSVDFYEGAYGVELILVHREFCPSWIISLRTLLIRSDIGHSSNVIDKGLITQQIRYQFDLTTIVKVEHMRPQTLTGSTTNTRSSTVTIGSICYWNSSTSLIFIVFGCVTSIGKKTFTCLLIAINRNEDRLIVH